MRDRLLEQLEVLVGDLSPSEPAVAPTRPRTSPSCVSKSTPSAARITPRGVRNSVCNPWTDSKGDSPSPPEPRVEDVAQAVPQQVDAHGKDHEREPRE